MTSIESFIVELVTVITRGIEFIGPPEDFPAFYSSLMYQRESVGTGAT